MTMEHIDVLIVGAGLSGIAAAYYLKTQTPQKSWTIVEGRDAMGGTWDLFRYPGVRSDSDMYTLGYTFNPWKNPKAIATGEDILAYIKETAAKFEIDDKIRYRHRVCGASWSSETALWTVDIQQSDGATKQMTCNFLFMCTGYYDYDAGYTPDFPGFDDFAGQIVHPQHWQSDLVYRDKRVVVIGSGATAVTLVPAMAEKAAHVTMLQRSPSYVVSRPSESGFDAFLYRVLPDNIAYKLTRRGVILMNMFFFTLARRRPERVKNMILHGVEEELGAEYDLTHFTPDYDPWDQRLCLVPDSDLFKSIKSGDVSVVTDHVECFTETGIQLRSGEHLDADIIVTATGLNVKLMKGVTLDVDGETIALADTFTYKGMMYSNIPNLVSAFGYINASWTLKCELISRFVCRLLTHMDKNEYQQCTPRPQQVSDSGIPVVDFSSGYVQRALSEMPSQGIKRPWRSYQNYIMDFINMRLGQLEDGALVFSRARGNRILKK
ncbi:MAG: flavin-containing monooxygenase [Aggregatilineales bacterium]